MPAARAAMKSETVSVVAPVAATASRCLRNVAGLTVYGAMNSDGSSATEW